MNPELLRMLAELGVGLTQNIPGVQGLLAPQAVPPAPQIPQTTPTANPVVPSPTVQVQNGNAPVSQTPANVTNPLQPEVNDPAILGDPLNIIPQGALPVDPTAVTPQNQDQQFQELFRGVTAPDAATAQRVSTPAAPRQPDGNFQNPLLALLLSQIQRGGASAAPQLPSLAQIL